MIKEVEVEMEEEDGMTQASDVDEVKWERKWNGHKTQKTPWWPSNP